MSIGTSKIFVLQPQSSKHLSPAKALWLKEATIPETVCDTEGHCKLGEAERMHVLTSEKTAEQVTPRASDNDGLEEWKKRELRLLAGPVFRKY